MSLVTSEYKATAMSLPLSFPDLPAQGGYLPYWLLLVSSAAFYNVAQSYVVQWQTKELYGRKPEQVTALTGRLLGTWNLLSAIIRLKHAYNVTDPSLYFISHVTFIIAAAHFGSELLVFGTVKINRAAIWPLIIGSSSSVWMYMQKGHYLGL